MLRFFLAFFCSYAITRRTGDWIFRPRWVVTMDACRRVIENGAVAVQGDRIVAVGTRAEIKGFQPKTADR